MVGAGPNRLSARPWAPRCVVIVLLAACWVTNQEVRDAATPEADVTIPLPDTDGAGGHLITGVGDFDGEGADDVAILTVGEASMTWRLDMVHGEDLQVTGLLGRESFSSSCPESRKTYFLRPVFSIFP